LNEFKGLKARTYEVITMNVNIRVKSATTVANRPPDFEFNTGGA